MEKIARKDTRRKIILALDKIDSATVQEIQDRYRLGERGAAAAIRIILAEYRRMNQVNTNQQ